jgi:hypothetical protein
VTTLACRLKHLPARRDEIGRDTAPYDRDGDDQNLEHPHLSSKRRGPHDGPDHHEAASPRPLTGVVPESLEAKRAALKTPSSEGVLDGSERAGRAGSRWGDQPNARPLVYLLPAGERGTDGGREQARQGLASCLHVLILYLKPGRALRKDSRSLKGEARYSRARPNRGVRDTSENGLAAVPITTS